jgi:Fur family ferric uptake transcriptional regulator
LHAQLRRNGHAIALSTVYRALRIYADDGRIDITHDPAGVQLFHGRPIPGHGHYLTCRACGDSTPINADVVEKWVAATAARHGFVDSHSIIELTGLCPACNLRTGSS